MENKIILVTGGNRGIGLGIVKGLAALGHRVLMGVRDVSKGREALEAIRDGKKHISLLGLDVSDKHSIIAAAEEIKEGYGRLDVLINNAGIIGKHKKALSEGDIREIKKVFKVNYYGPMRMNAVFLPLLRKSGQGRIINVSSGMGALDDLVGGYAGYRLSKAGLNAQTIQLANELREDGIGVFAMCPGWVRTDMGGENAPRSVEEGADTVIWLATSEHPRTGLFYRNRQVIPW